MKFKDWKQDIKNEAYNIPDVYDKIKNAAFTRDIKPKKLKTILIFNFTSKRMAYGMISVLLFCIVAIVISLGSRNLYDSVEGPESLSFFTTKNEINEILSQNNQLKLAYSEMSSNKLKIMPELFNSQDKPNDIAAVNLNKLTPSLTNFRDDLDKADIVKVDGSFIYYISASNFSVIKTNKGTMDLAYSENFTNYNLRYLYDERQNEIYVTEDYIIVIFTSVVEKHINRSDEYSNYELDVIIYNKNDYTKALTYKIYSNYLESQLIDNKLYLISNISISYYINNPAYDIPMPSIYENGFKREVTPRDIGYLNNYLGETYTVLSWINLDNLKINNIIQISFDNWDVIYITKESLYLISNYLNYNKTLEYGYYTSIIRYNLDNENGIKYSSSYTYKGNLLDEFSIDEYNGYLRIATTVDDYDVNYNLFNTSVKITNRINRIIVLKEISYRSGNKLQLVGNLEGGFGVNDEYIQSVRFIDDSAYVVSSLTSSPVYIFDLSNPYKPTLKDKINSSNINYLYHLDKNNAITFSYAYTEDVFCRLSFYSTENHQITPWSINDYHIRYDHFNKGRKYNIFIESIPNNRALYVNKLNEKVYLGFSIQDTKRQEGNYMLFMIDVDKRTYNTITFSHINPSTYYEGRKFLINRMVDIIDNQTYFYTLSDGLIVSYNQDFVKIDLLTIPTM